MKITDDILFFHAPEEHLHQQPADGKNYLADSHSRLFAHVINRLNGDVRHSEIENIQTSKGRWVGRSACTSGPNR